MDSILPYKVLRDSNQALFILANKFLHRTSVTIPTKHKISPRPTQMLVPSQLAYSKKSE